MFTNEFEWDETITTVLDDEGKYEDVQLFIDHEVFIRQWNEQRNAYELICISPKMFQELIQALSHTEGAYLMEIRKE